MPRSRGGAGPSRSAPSRPSAPSAPRPAPQQQQTRPMSTTAPARPGQAPVTQQSQGSGLFGQMASTAAGVAVGSSIGHAIGGFFGGGSSAAPAEQQQYQQPIDSYAQPGQAMDSNLYAANTNARSADMGPCSVDIKNFTQCMQQNQGDLNVCGWYMEQMKACQAAASRY